VGREVLEQEEAGEVDGVRRDERVASVCRHLVDEQIKRLARVSPDQMVRRGGADELDVVKTAQLVDQRCGIVERIRPIGQSCRTQPRDPHAN
jgi:hypothetical protein